MTLPLRVAAGGGPLNDSIMASNRRWVRRGHRPEIPAQRSSKLEAMTLGF